TMSGVPSSTSMIDNTIPSGSSAGMGAILSSTSNSQTSTQQPDGIGSGSTANSPAPSSPTAGSVVTDYFPLTLVFVLNADQPLPTKKGEELPPIKFVCSPNDTGAAEIRLLGKYPDKSGNVLSIYCHKGDYMYAELTQDKK